MITSLAKQKKQKKSITDCVPIAQQLWSGSKHPDGVDSLHRFHFGKTRPIRFGGHKFTPFSLWKNEARPAEVALSYIHQVYTVFTLGKRGQAGWKRPSYHLLPSSWRKEPTDWHFYEGSAFLRFHSFLILTGKDEGIFLRDMKGKRRKVYVLSCQFQSWTAMRIRSANL